MYVMGRLHITLPGPQKRMNADDPLLTKPCQNNNNNNNNNSSDASPRSAEPRPRSSNTTGESSDMLVLTSRHVAAAAASSNGSSSSSKGNNAVSQQHRYITDERYSDQRRPRQLLFYRNGDRYFRGKRLRITPNRFQSFESLLSELTKHMSLPYGVRKVYHPQTGASITDIEDLENGGSYVCASFEKFKKISYGTLNSTPGWSNGHTSNHSQLQGDLYGRFSYSYPSTGKYAAAYGRSPGGDQSSPNKGSNGQMSMSFPAMRKPTRSYKDTGSLSKSTGLLHSDLSPARPKLCKIVKAGSTPKQTVSLLLNKRSVQSFEQLVQDISDAFGLPKYKNHRIRKIYTMGGKEIRGIGDFFRNPDEAFIASPSKHAPTAEEAAEICSNLYPQNAYVKSHSNKTKRTKGKENTGDTGRDGYDRREGLIVERPGITPRESTDDEEVATHEEVDEAARRRQREEAKREEANRRKAEELRLKEEELQRKEDELQKQLARERERLEEERLAAIARREAELDAKAEELRKKEEAEQRRKETEEKMRQDEERLRQKLEEDKRGESRGSLRNGDGSDSPRRGGGGNNKKPRFVADPREIVDTDSILKRYTIGPKIGDGNFADVHEATLRNTEQMFALKIVDKAKLDGKEHMIENEIGVMKNVKHPNIVKLFEEHETEENIYLVMEYVRGGDLFDAITESVKFTEADASIIVGDMASALAYLHSMNVVHRDLKPENLLVSKSSTGDITLKLADFGLAMEVKMPIFTVCGTPTYVAPEILSETGYGLEVDMWAVGVICYILLCGFPPFRSLDRDQEELFEIIQTGQFIYLSPYWDNISDGAKDLINHLLVVDRRHRYTAPQVLAHPWITSGGGTVKGSLPNLQREVSMNLEKNFDGRKSGRRKGVTSDI